MNHISIGGVQLDEIRTELSNISNELHQINENTRLHYGDIIDLKFANEIIDEQRKAIKILKEENKQLKSTIKEVTELLSEEVDLFSEKATEHDIIAYVELKELDNKDAYYMATATKKAIRMLKELEE
jgi:ethanolamine utilization protein EutA (predicted chaperonin)